MSVLIEPVKEKRFVLGQIYTNPYPAHLHDALEILILRRGYMNITVNGTHYMLKPDTIATVFPGIIHSYESISEDAKGLVVDINPSSIAEFRKLLNSQVPVKPVIQILDCEKEITGAISKLEKYACEEELYPLAPAYIHLLLACVFMHQQFVPSDEKNRGSLECRVMQYIQVHSRENLSLDSVAKEMGIGRSHLSHLFSQKLNIHFRQFLNTIRIEKACQLLHDPSKSIKEVCFECGFTSTRTFHRAFMAEQKMTPLEYREKIANTWLTNTHKKRTK